MVPRPTPLLRLILIATLLCSGAACPPTAPGGKPGATPGSAEAGEGCTKDTDCKGQRICEKRICVDPAPGSPGTLPRLGGSGAQGAETGSRSVTASLTADAPASGQALSVGPMFRGGPSHPGRSPFRGPEKKPKEVWRFRTGGPIFSSPLVSPDGSTVYLGSHDHHVYAVHTKDGTLRWRHVTGERVWSSPALGPDGTLYVGSDDDKLYALDPAGKVKWAFALGPCRTASIGSEATRCDADSSPAVGPDGTIYVGGDALYALKPDGTVKWRYTTGANDRGAHLFSSPALAKDGTVYIGGRDKRVHAVKPDGTQKWTYVLTEDVDSSPSVGDDGTIYIGADDHRILALRPDGTLRWGVTTLGDIRSSPAVAADGTVVAGSFDGRVYAVRPDGTVKWLYATGKHIYSSPIIDKDGVIYIGSQDGRVHAIGPDGALRWTVEIDAEVDSSPTLGPDGTLYVGADDGTLRAFR